MKKKVLFLSTLPPPFYGSSLSSQMCLKILNSEKSFQVNNIKLNYSKAISDVGKVSFNKFLGIFKTTISIIKQLRTLNPDIIYFVPAVTGIALIRDFFFLKIIRIFRRGVLVLHIRGQFKSNDWGNPFIRLIIKDLLKCDKIILLGNELIDNLHNCVPMEKVFILQNALPSSLSDSNYSIIREKKQLKKEIHLLFLSILRESKGLFKMLEVCKILSDKDIEHICHFVGEWQSEFEKQKFIKYVSTHNLNRRIVLHGRLIGTEKEKILSESDILIFPTEYDAGPRVILEAMEFGLPVISTRVGAIPSMVIHGETGFLVKENIASEIVPFVIDLLDRNLRVKMGKLSRERFLKEFTMEKYKDRFITVLNN